MKNADLPAYPTYELNGQNVLQDTIYGLTKREMFAMSAPECPGWYASKFKEENWNNVELLNDAHNFTIKGQMQLLKQWRYAYADLMLGESK